MYDQEGDRGQAYQYHYEVRADDISLTHISASYPTPHHSSSLPPSLPFPLPPSLVPSLAHSLIHILTHPFITPSLPPSSPTYIHTFTPICNLQSFRYSPTNIEVISWLGAYHMDSQFPDKAIHYFERAALIQYMRVHAFCHITQCHCTA